MNKRWILKPVSDAEIESIQNELKVNSTFARLLALRGITNKQKAISFFNPKLSSLHDPFLMQDMPEAVLRIEMAIKKNENILVYGDYDVDGTTSVAMMYDFLHQYTDNISFYIPDRYTEGYGISEQAIDTAIDSEVDLIIALDCGIKAIDKVQKAHDAGIDMIICDHHEPGEQLPPALAVLDPKRSDCKYPYKELSGCGVGFKLIQAFLIRKEIPVEAAYQYLDLLAISIGADLVPLTGENRVMAYFGLQLLNQNPRPGIKALLNASNKNKQLSMGDIGFHIGPRINAAGRMDQGVKAVKLLTSSNPMEIEDIAKDIENDNTTRREFEQFITEEAIQQYESLPNFQDLKTIFVYQDNWNKGVIGIVASRLVERYYKPCVILTQSNGVWCGSARSVAGFNLYEALERCLPTMIQFGGHAHAAGMTVAAEQIESFKAAFEKAVSASITDEQLIPQIHIDSAINLSEINDSFLNFVNQLGPFGPGNSKPSFVCEHLKVKGEPRMLKGLHLKATMTDDQSKKTIDSIGFNFANRLSVIQNNTHFRGVFTLEENHWNGNKSIQMLLRDISD